MLSWKRLIWSIVQWFLISNIPNNKLKRIAGSCFKILAFNLAIKLAVNNFHKTVSSYLNFLQTKNWESFHKTSFRFFQELLKHIYSMQVVSPLTSGSINVAERGALLSNGKRIGHLFQNQLWSGKKKIFITKSFVLQILTA